MRRLVFSIIVATGFVMVGSSSASAEDPTPAPTVSAKATPGKKLCKITDPRLDEISGLVATKTGYVVIDDGTEESAKREIFFLNKKCAVVETQEYSGEGPRDTEDLILSADGKTLWIADIGDNVARDKKGEPRKNIAVWKMAADGSKKPTLYRMSYPDGDAHDAEALLIDGDGLPLVITKEIGATAGVYKPSGPLVAKNTDGVAMTRVAELSVNPTETAGNAVARIGNRTITGGAVAPGGDKVALRTYTDALEWDVKNGDVVAALKNEPRTTGLPNEPFGESISYSTDGRLFLTVSDMNGDKETANNIREYTPATEIAAVSAKSGQDSSGGSWYSNLTVDDVTWFVAGIGGLGLILVAAGVFGIVRFRKSPAAIAAAEADDLPGGLNTGDPETELIGVGGLPQRAAAYGRPGGGSPVYGAAAQSGPAPGAPGPQRGGGPAPAGPQRGGNGVYGGVPAGAAQGNAQYRRPGGSQPGGQQPGGQKSGGQPPGGQKSGGQPVGAPQPGGPQQPARGPQQGGQRGPQSQPGRGPGPQSQPGRGPGPQSQPGRGPGPQSQPGRGPGPQQQPGRGPGPQSQPGRGGGAQPQPARGGGGQSQPGRGGPQQGGGARGPQQPRGPQGAPQGGPRGPQQGGPRGPQQPGRGQQPPRGGGGAGGGVYGGGPAPQSGAPQGPGPKGGGQPGAGSRGGGQQGPGPRGGGQQGPGPKGGQQGPVRGPQGGPPQGGPGKGGPGQRPGVYGGNRPPEDRNYR
ncbi:hypothetical protein [Actinoplanes sp. DH11]|uniref:hypothetical protein n=1 Tax=Actinoplanes sp. DH11 TaxID=2857011 RepID=UPI0035B10268